MVNPLYSCKRTQTLWAVKGIRQPLTLGKIPEIQEYFLEGEVATPPIIDYHLPRLDSVNRVVHRGWCREGLGTFDFQTFGDFKLRIRDRREYRYRIEKADTKPFGISISLDRGCF